MNKTPAFYLLFASLFFLWNFLPKDLRAQTTNTKSQTSLTEVMSKLNEMDKKLNELDKKLEVRSTRLETKMENLEDQLGTIRDQIKDNKTDMWTLFGSLILLYLFVLGVVLAIYRNVRMGKISKPERISRSFVEEIRSQLQTMNEQIRQMSRREEMLEKRVAELENSGKAK